MVQQTTMASSHRRNAFTLIEVTVSTLLVGFILVASLKSVGSTLSARQLTADQSLAATMAHELMTEILAKSYEDAESPVFGKEVGEGIRNLYDDVDDYHNWSSSPPRGRTGGPIMSLTGWTRSVTVEWVDPASPLASVGSEQDLKKVTITVQRNGITHAQIASLKRRED